MIEVAVRPVLALLAIGVVALGPAASQSPPRPADAHVLEVRGAIGPAVSDFITGGIEKAHAAGAKAVILRLDTPGGLDTSMRTIIKAVLAAPIPVITYVAPAGSRAASAGTYLMYASHVAAMAPATNLGAATPVRIGPGAKPPGGGSGKDEEAEEDSPSGDAMERKIVNDAVAYIRGLARLRGRNAEWAESAVRTGASLPAEEALEKDVIDLLAPDLDALLRALDGRTVEVAGSPQTLATAEWRLRRVEPDWRQRLLAVITNPTVAYLLMLIGVYGLLFEFYTPGMVGPGVVGAIALLLALYAFQALPVNFAGAALIGLGIALMVFETTTPSFGVIGAGGVVAFVIGSVILIDTDTGALAVSRPVIAVLASAGAGLIAATAWLSRRQRDRPVVSGRERMLGGAAVALESFDTAGRVRTHGEIWSARARAPVAEGETLTICAIDGLVLEVEPAREEDGR